MKGSDQTSSTGSTWLRFETDSVVNAMLPFRTFSTLSRASPSCREWYTWTVTSPLVSSFTRLAKNSAV